MCTEWHSCLMIRISSGSPKNAKKPTRIFSLKINCYDGLSSLQDRFWIRITGNHTCLIATLPPTKKSYLRIVQLHCVCIFIFCYFLFLSVSRPAANLCLHQETKLKFSGTILIVVKASVRINQESS